MTMQKGIPGKDPDHDLVLRMSLSRVGSYLQANMCKVGMVLDLIDPVPKELAPV